MTGSSARKPSARPSNIALKCYSDSACVMFWHGRNYACGKFFPQTGLFAKSNPFVFSCPRLALKLQYLRADEVAQSGCASGISARVLDSVAPFFVPFYARSTADLQALYQTIRAAEVPYSATHFSPLRQFSSSPSHARSGSELAGCSARAPRQLVHTHR